MTTTRFADHIIGPDIHTNRPAVTAVGIGSLFSCSTHSVVYRSDGAIWEDYLIAEVAAVPVGTVLLWSGSVASIPTGYALCDGTNGTPNLVDRFIVGADAVTALTSGGTITPRAAITAHTMGAIDPTATAGVSPTGIATTAAAQVHTHPAPTITAHAVPKWFALAYIMKL